MKRVAARQTRLVNRLERRSGTLWVSRFHSSPIETDAYLLACCRYVEMNPVRAGMVAAPEEYPWSSCRSRVGMDQAEWLDDDPSYIALGEDATERRRRYREWLLAAVPAGEWDLIRTAVQRNQLTGGNLFTEEVERKVGVRVEVRGPGRPKG
jgi:putative transposase